MNKSIKFESFFFLVLSFITLNAQDQRELLINDFSIRIEQAKEKNVHFLSPKNFKKSSDYYFEAFNNYNQSKNIQIIKSNLQKAEKYLEEAIKTSEIGNNKLKLSLIAREDAKKVDADNLTYYIWEKAENILQDAINEIEDGDTIAAINYSFNSQKLFREAELESIKISILKNCWNLIEKAKREGVDKYAPKILQNAIELSQKAESEIIEDRYETNSPNKISEQAVYEVNHAIYITNFIKSNNGKDNKLEDIFLNAELPFQKIASYFNLDLRFDQPFDNAANEIVQKIVNLKYENDELNQENSDLHRKILLIEEDLSEAKDEKLTFEEIIKEFKKSKTIQEKIFNLFDKDEAEVLIQNGNLVIRIIGLNFNTSDFKVEKDNYPLFSKIQSVFEEFPENNIIIQAYSDIYEDDKKNIELSESQAYEVKNLLVTKYNIYSDKIIAIGYGKVNTILSSDKKESSDFANRIEIIIQNARF